MWKYQYLHLKCFFFNQQKLMDWRFYLKLADKNIILSDYNIIHG